MGWCCVGVVSVVLFSVSARCRGHRGGSVASLVLCSSPFDEFDDRAVQYRPFRVTQNVHLPGLGAGRDGFVPSLLAIDVVLLISTSDILC